MAVVVVCVSWRVSWCVYSCDKKKKKLGWVDMAKYPVDEPASSL